MRPSLSAAFFLSTASSLLLATAVRAETFGSLTKVSISAAYTLPGTQTVTNFSDGAYRSVTAVDTVRYTNVDILNAMVQRGLITTIKGYSLVMLRTEVGTRSFTFVATHATLQNVRVPEDLLYLSFADGPQKGRYAYNAKGIITDLAFETRNLAALHLAGFDGQSILLSKSGRKNVTSSGVTHTIKLDTASAAFDGAVTVGDKTGVGTASFALSAPRVVKLDDYPTTAPDGSEDTQIGTSGVTVSGAGTLTLSGPTGVTGITIIGGTLTLNNP